jgi:methylglyoxal synthase
MTHGESHSLRIALVAHDNKKRDLAEWARYNLAFLARHELWATGTTGSLLERELGQPVFKLQSGPLGGDQQLGALIAEGKVDFLVFFWDPLEPQPHDPDVKALLRLAVVWNIPMACNRASADLMISSPLVEGGYERTLPDYETYLGRALATDAPPEAADAPPEAADGTSGGATA